MINIINMLLVEDNPGDIRLIAEILKESKLQVNLRIAEDGVQALAKLRRDGNYKDEPRPDIIMLDLNLPKKDGRELLADIKNDGNLKRIPVVILTSSNAERDILKAYGLHANCYITKPVGLEDFMNVIKRIEDFWLTVVTLPGEQSE